MHLRKRVLVTGGAGFLGSFLCERLLAEGCDVICVDNFYTGTKRNIIHLLNNPYFEFIRHDITFPLYSCQVIIEAVNSKIFNHPVLFLQFSLYN
mgnify:CR=1 FL=1